MQNESQAARLFWTPRESRQMAPYFRRKRQLSTGVSLSEWAPSSGGPKGAGGAPQEAAADFWPFFSLIKRPIIRQAPFAAPWPAFRPVFVGNPIKWKERKEFASNRALLIWLQDTA